MDKYLVVFHKHEWIVKHGLGGFEAYPSRAAAIAAAVEQAETSRKADTSVVVQDNDAFFRTEWTSGAEAPQPHS